MNGEVSTGNPSLVPPPPIGTIQSSGLSCPGAGLELMKRCFWNILVSQHFRVLSFESPALSVRLSCFSWVSLPWELLLLKGVSGTQLPKDKYSCAKGGKNSQTRAWVLDKFPSAKSLFFCVNMTVLNVCWFSFLVEHIKHWRLSPVLQVWMCPW